MIMPIAEKFGSKKKRKAEAAAASEPPADQAGQPATAQKAVAARAGQSKAAKQERRLDRRADGQSVDLFFSDTPTPNGLRFVQSESTRRRITPRPFWRYHCSSHPGKKYPHSMC